MCVIPLTLTPNSLIEYRECRLAEQQVSFVSQHIPLIQEHFLTKEDQIKALRIIYCESRGKINAVGKNKDGTYDKGLWQFNDNTWAWLKGKLKFTGDRFDPLLSTKVARWLIYNDGWKHWNSSKKCWYNENKNRSFYGYKSRTSFSQ
ncbi:MAG: hypothetical protein Tp156SUR915002_11 [Prokaryotic dsDNA virus sp.]|nr:MAG: hypothetical protein Tp162SUR384061_20 [Prokaryotic dsDNA virus sp.]QDP59750.1 MAG: hypothetical protein Tp156SUR915002_11 [Prokaryotic dsDNA virus sp.]